MRTKNTTLALVFFTLGFGCLLSACKHGAKDILASSKDAIVTIYTFDEYGSPAGLGSGFLIDDQGHGITNYHVLDGCVKAKLRTSDGKEYEIDSVLVSDRKRDIVKFSIRNGEGVNFKYLKFNEGEIAQGDKVYNISSPLGLEQTLSEGIISAIREDSHGSTVQITAPISSGSSGSPILNEKGKVIAVATFLSKGGQSLNFGVNLDKDKLADIKGNDFDKRNRKFNKKDNFVILNVPATNEAQIKLNALEFKSDATIAYFSYTNLNMNDAEGTIYCEPNKGDDGFTIIDLSNDKKYHMLSSTIGDKKEQTAVPLASTVQFKVTFPGIKNHKDLKEIEIRENQKARGWKFEDIDLEDYRDNLEYDLPSYNKNYAYATLHDGDFNQAMALFLMILDEDPEEEDALNAMGILSYVQSNLKDAEDYFSQAIDAHPAGPLAYKNRSKLYLEMGNKRSAMADLSTLIGMDTGDMDCYIYRALLYMADEEWKSAKDDLSTLLASEDYKDDPWALYYRACCYCYLKDFKSANEDLQKAYKNSDDGDLDKLISRLYQSIP